MSSCLLVTLLGEHLNENTISNQKYVGCRQIGGNIQERDFHSNTELAI